MRQVISWVFIIFVSLSALCQSPFGRYSSRMTQDGMIYFLMPTKLKNLDGIKKFEYDVTLLNWTDSATVNFTIRSESKLIPEDLKIKTDKGDINCAAYHPLYIDVNKKGYEIRITSQFSVKEIEEILKIQPTLQFLCSPKAASWNQLPILSVHGKRTNSNY